MNSNYTDMTQGSPLKLMVRFSVPLLIGNIFQQMYNMVDSIVVGNFVGSAALAAVGTSFIITWTLISMFIGIGTGATILISQLYGFGDRERLKRSIETANTALLYVSIPLTLIGVFGTPLLLRLTNVPDDTYDMARIYLMITFLGMLPNLGYNMNSGVLRGLGDSKSPLKFLIVSTVINIVLDVLFVAVFHWGVAGAAIATIIAQFIAWIYSLVFLRRHYADLELRLFNPVPDRALLKKIIRLGVPIGLNQCLFSIGILVLQALINSYGSDFMAGYSAAGKLDSFAFMPLMSFSSAATTFAGQNIGAGRYDRLKSGILSTLGMSIVVSVVISGLVLLFGRPMMHLFTQSATVIDAGMNYLHRIMPFYWMLTIMFILNGFMNGAGAVLVPTIANLANIWVGRVPSAYVFAHYFGKENIFFCFAFGWIFGVAITGLYFLSGKWKNKGVVQ